jgi:hypothetical protein
VWTVVLAGLFAAMRWMLPALLPDEVGVAGEPVGRTAAQFVELTAVVVAIGVVLLTQGVLLDERRNGVLEWLLSKPMTRPALVVAKLAGHALGLVTTAVVLPWIGVGVLLGVAAGSPWPLSRLAGTVAMLVLVVVFHLALVLALSTVTDSRAMVLALPLAAIVGSDLVTAIAPAAFEVLPWSLGRVAGAWLGEGVLVTLRPALATLGWTVLLAVFSAWRLERAEW